MDIASKSALLAVAAPQLLAASKAQDETAILETINLGVTLFGENRVQEAMGKWPSLKAAHPGIRLHLIGPLQSNKVRDAVELFDVIQTLDRESLADALSAEMKKTGKSIPCFIQINTGKEPQKAGVEPEQLDAFITYCRSLGLTITGLMCIPPADYPSAPHFAMLRALAKKYDLSELSMGMSEDYMSAISLGSTCVRVGRALFGERDV